MKITDLLDLKSIDLEGKSSSKSDVLNQMVDLMAKSGKISDLEQYRHGVFERENEGTTGIGEGIAIPHCKSDAVLKPGLAAMVVKDGVDFDSLDGEKVHLLFLIAAPNTEDNIHLDVLSKLSILLMNEEFTKELRASKDIKEFIAVIEKYENARDLVEEGKENMGKYIVAVTACPTGIAHTFMAAESLMKVGNKKGVSIKVETNGSSGAKSI